MLIALHKNARTTPAVRAEIAASNEPASVPAQRFGITEQTVYKWKKRSVFADRSHTAHRLQTVLTPAQETVVVHLWRTLLLHWMTCYSHGSSSAPRSRSGLTDACAAMWDGQPQRPKPRRNLQKRTRLLVLRARLRMDVKRTPDAGRTQRRYLPAHDRATRWVFVQSGVNKTWWPVPGAFLKEFHKACLTRDQQLTDNGKGVTTDRLPAGSVEPSAHHEFDQLCQELGTEHRLTKPRTPRTNGMVERFNGRIATSLNPASSTAARETSGPAALCRRNVHSHQLPQSALKRRTRCRR